MEEEEEEEEEQVEGRRRGQVWIRGRAAALADTNATDYLGFVGKPMRHRGEEQEETAFSRLW